MSCEHVWKASLVAGYQAHITKLRTMSIVTSKLTSSSCVHASDFAAKQLIFSSAHSFPTCLLGYANFGYRTEGNVQVYKIAAVGRITSFDASMHAPIYQESPAEKEIQHYSVHVRQRHSP